MTAGRARQGTRRDQVFARTGTAEIDAKTWRQFGD